MVEDLKVIKQGARSKEGSDLAPVSLLFSVKYWELNPGLAHSRQGLYHSTVSQPSTCSCPDTIMESCLSISGDFIMNQKKVNHLSN